MSVNKSIDGEVVIDTSEIYTQQLYINNNLLPAELTNLATAEIQQLENINSTVISSNNWSYVPSLNQNLSTTSNVKFNTITYNGITGSTGTFNNISVNGLTGGTGYFNNLTCGTISSTSINTNNNSITCSNVNATNGTLGNVSYQIGDSATGIYRVSNDIYLTLQGVVCAIFDQSAISAGNYNTNLGLNSVPWGTLYVNNITSTGTSSLGSLTANSATISSLTTTTLTTTRYKLDGYQATGQTITNNTNNYLYLDTMYTTVGFSFTPGTSSSTITCPVSGWYLVTASLLWPTASSGYGTLTIFMNGTTKNYGQLSAFSSSQHTGITASAMGQLSATQTIRVAAYQSSGGSVTLYNCNIQVCLLSE